MEIKNILSISVEPDTGNYQINVAQGSNVAETMFAISAMIRCFVRDGIIDDVKIATDMLNRYLTEEQYEEVRDDNL